MNGPTNDRARGTAALRRPLVLGVAWAASAAAAVGLGFLAVSLLDASASSGTPQVAAATSSAPEGGAGPTATRFVPRVTSATGEFATAAGTVYATCGTGLPVLAGVPVAGWRIDDSGEQGKVEFENGTQQIEVRVACVDGSPRFASEGIEAEDGATSISAHMPPARAPEPTAVPTTSDDHGGGGHGADDGPGDDSGGHGGGGHGSDG